MIFKIDQSSRVDISSKVYSKLKNTSLLNRIFQYDKELIEYYSITIEFKIEGDVELGVGTIIAFNTKESHTPLFRVLHIKDGIHFVEQMQYTNKVIRFDNEFMVISESYGG